MRKSYILIALSFLLSSQLIAQSTAGYELEAKYKFVSDAKDSTGNYVDATTINANYTQGGIYSNGIYYGNNNVGSLIKTPSIAAFPMSDFIVKLDFNVELVNRHLLACGNSWRWIMLYTKPDSTLEFSVNKTDGYQAFNTTFKVSPGTWQTLGIAYDSTTKILKLYVDNNQVSVDTLSANFKHQNDFTFSNQDGGIGETYRGYWKNLEVFKPVSIGIPTIEDNSSFIVYPNPSLGSIKIKTNSKTNEIALIDVTGKLVKHLSVKNEDLISIDDIPKGVYFLTVSNNKTTRTEKIIVH